MRKIKLTEAQAKLLGLDKLKENDFTTNQNDSGMKSVGGALGPKPVRVIIEDGLVQQKHEQIITIIKKQDPLANLKFYELTNKIVGTVSETKISAITRDLRAFDPNILFYRKTANSSLKDSKKVKLTKEQYNKLITSGLIKEGIEIIGGPSIKKSAEGGEVKEVSEQDVTLKKEVKELLKFMYRKSENLSPFWEDNGLTFDEICDKLTKDKIIISTNGKFEISKSLGTPEEAIQKLEQTLKIILNGKKTKNPESEIDEAGDYPVGAKDDKNAPYNQVNNTTTPKKVQSVFKVVAMNKEIAIVKGPDNLLYVFWYYDIPKNNFKPYATIDKTYLGKDGEGEPDFEYGDFEIDETIIEAYLNDNINQLHKGNGYSDYEQGAEFVRLDEPLKKELIDLYDKNPLIVKALTTLQEMTSAASSGAFTAPLGVVTKKMPINPIDVPVVKETTTQNAGNYQYDVNALPDIDRDGSFKKHKKTNAEKKTQWAGGSFVKTNGCTKYNNKPAGDGCSQGAVDNVVTTTKTKDNITTPSLGKG